jgi:hypothetical protein
MAHPAANEYVLEKAIHFPGGSWKTGGSLYLNLFTCFLFFFSHDVILCLYTLTLEHTTSIKNARCAYQQTPETDMCHFTSVSLHPCHVVVESIFIMAALKETAYHEKSTDFGRSEHNSDRISILSNSLCAGNLS